MDRKKRRKLASDTFVCIDEEGRMYKELQLPMWFDIKKVGYFVILYGRVKGKRDHLIKI